jgi:hypothetical protein
MEHPCRQAIRPMKGDEAGDLTALVTDLRARIAAARLSPPDQVRALAELLAAVGWALAEPGLSGDRRALEAALTSRGDLASALILQGAVLQEWIGAPSPLAAETAPVDREGRP